MNNRIELARQAFYGINTELSNLIYKKLGKCVENTNIPSGVASLQEFVDVMQSLSDSELLELKLI